MKKSALPTAQIGASGVLLLRYRLLKLGIESAPLTTDTGIDLVVYAPSRKRAITVQVKTCLKSKPGGGKGKLALDWWLRNDSPAELVALVNLATDQAWIFRHSEFEKEAQQTSSGRMHLYFYESAGRSPHTISKFAKYALEKRLSDIFGIGAGARRAPF